MFSREEWLSRNQIQAYFSRLSALKRKQGSASTPPQVAQDDMDDVVEEEEWLQQVVRCMINYQSSIQYTMIHTIFVIYMSDTEARFI